ncbi:MAG: glutathione peroxidase [Pseudomonadota bacterium]
MSESLYDIPFHRINGDKSSLAEYRGKVLLLVNVASKCGLTPQYDRLEKLYEDKREAGLVVVGFPANNFGEQEPGSNNEILDFCRGNFGVKFPLTEKISVKGPDQHPLYSYLTAAQPTLQEESPALREKLAGYGFTQESPSDVLWNFEKFLISRDGKVVARFAPDVAPNSPLLLSAIEKELT